MKRLGPSKAYPGWDKLEQEWHNLGWERPSWARLGGERSWKETGGWREIVWRPGIPREFPDYRISADGQVMRVTRAKGARAGQVLKQRLSNGYLIVWLYGRPWTIARLVAWAYLPEPPTPISVVHYRDGDVLNCHYTNLYWGNKTRG